MAAVLPLFNFRSSLFLTLAIVFAPVAAILFEFICGIIAISFAVADQIVFGDIRIQALIHGIRDVFLALFTAIVKIAHPLITALRDVAMPIANVPSQIINAATKFALAVVGIVRLATPFIFGGCFLFMASVITTDMTNPLVATVAIVSAVAIIMKVLDRVHPIKSGDSATVAMTDTSETTAYSSPMTSAHHLRGHEHKQPGASSRVDV